VQEALQRHPTILFLHGNCATRAFGVRVQYYKAFTARLRANVLAIDYRGFADSTGQPSEDGLVRDGRAAWDWLISQGAKQEDILIMGHSLGTGVTAQLGAQLDGEGIDHRGLVLLSVRMLGSRTVPQSDVIYCSLFPVFENCWQHIVFLAQYLL
jgi:abhydrolase domain-containing protein 12